MAFATAPAQQDLCWQCGQPAHRTKHGYGACFAHCLPTKEQRTELKTGAKVASITTPRPTLQVVQPRTQAPAHTQARKATAPKADKPWPKPSGVRCGTCKAKAGHKDGCAFAAWNLATLQAHQQEYGRQNEAYCRELPAWLRAMPAPPYCPPQTKPEHRYGRVPRALRTTAA